MGFSYWVQDINVYRDIHIATADSVLELLDDSFGAIFVYISCCDDLESAVGIIVQIGLLRSKWRANPGVNGGMVGDQAFLMRNMQKCSLSRLLMKLISSEGGFSERQVANAHPGLLSRWLNKRTTFVKLTNLITDMIDRCIL